MPGTEPVKFAVVSVPAQTVWLAWVFTVGIGFTVIVKVLITPVHVTPPLE